MTRINTNVSSLNAQKTLARSSVQLQEALNRLSSGLRINVGKDDPAGLIASEVLRSDIISVERAITNSQRANQMIATADSALGQVSALLNDVRGLVSEAANTGAMSQAQISANQLQIDSSLEAIDRIAQVTQFQGKRLLDGSLDFITEGLDNNKIADLRIDQANFGTQTEIGVAVDVVTQATQASLTYEYGAIADDVVLEIGGTDGFEAFTFAAGSTIEDMAKAINLVADALGVAAKVQTEATAGTITGSSYGADNDIVITADTPGEDEGNIRLKFTANRLGNDTLTASYTAASGNDAGTLDVQLETEKWAQSSYFVNEGGDNIADNAFRITAKYAGAEFNGITLVVSTAGTEALLYDHSSTILTLTVLAAGATNANDVEALFTGDARINSLFTFSHELSSDGSGAISPAAAGDWGQDITGVDGGAIVSTGNDLVTKINVTATLLDDVTATLAANNDGHEIVTPFQEYAFYGDANANNRLQFLGPEDAKNIRFVSAPDQSLSIDLGTDPEVLGFSSALVQGLDANTSFTVTARQKGTEYDDIEIVMVDSGVLGDPEVATWDAENKTLTVNVDITTGTTNVDTVIDLINNKDTVSKFFQANLWGTAVGTANLTDTNFVGTVATTTGGVVSEGSVIINLETDADGVLQTTANDLIAFFDDPAYSADLQPLGISVANIEGSDGSGLLSATTDDLVFATSGTDLQDSYASTLINATEGLDALFTVTAKVSGADYNDVLVDIEDTVTAGNETVTYDAVTKKLTISIEAGVTTAGYVVGMFTGVNPGATAEVMELFTAALATDVYGITGNDSSGLDPLTASDEGILADGVVDQGTQDGAALLGNEDEANTGLSFHAVEYGADAFVSVRSLNATSFIVVDKDGNVTTRAVGTDVDARINGIQAVGSGLDVQINTSALDFSLSLSETVVDGESMKFTIVGGGAQFQLGPDVVSNQQARLGISSVNTAKLGGVSGRLFQMRSGGPRDLKNDVIGAAAIIEEVISQVTMLRGRLGAFQRTTLETNIAALSDTLEALTEAESSIRDADFAKESANLTRAQILVQSGLSVLTIANQNPQSVLALLR